MKMVRLLCLAPVFAIAAIAAYFLFFCGPPPLPDLPLDEWWGPPDKKLKQDFNVKNFRIKLKEQIIEDVRQRVKNSRAVPTPLEGITHEYGFDSRQVPEWMEYWTKEYNISQRQKFFNQFEHYKTNIQGLDIHFIHVQPEVPEGVDLVPVLLLHGWPGSVREFYEAIPMLTAVQKDRNFALELVVPSLPGYGFSDAAVRPGLGAAEVAVVLRNLMHRIGFKQFYIQGGDWGAMIGSHMATLFPEEVLGFHTNMAISMSPYATLLEIIGSYYPPLVVDPALADRLYPLDKRFSFFMEELGYMHLQATKPDTIGVALSDSPTALLAYILEKFSTWTDRNQRPLLDHFTREQLIDNLMCYWSTNSITSAMRLYAETFNKRQSAYKLDVIPTKVPTWALQAKYENYQPPCILKLKYHNLVNVTVLDDGGHFIAFEKPEVFAEDVVKAIGEFRKVNKIRKTEL